MLLSVFTEIWPYIVPFVSALLSAAVGYAVATITFRRSEASKQSQESVNEKKLWRILKKQSEKQKKHQGGQELAQCDYNDYMADMPNISSFFGK